jgi:hypothetical protein
METLLTEITGDSLFYQSRAIFRELAVSNATEDVRGKRDDGPDKLQCASHGDADDAEWQQQEPDDGIQDQCNQGQWPAHYEEHAPDKETKHANSGYAKAGGKFRARVGE